MSADQSASLPKAEQRILQTPHGPAVGSSFRWDGGQYCAIHTRRGVLGCGVYELACADEFGMAFAIAKGTPEQPLFEPEDLLEATIVGASRAARELGIDPGMSGREALACLLRDC